MATLDDPNREERRQHGTIGQLDVELGRYSVTLGPDPAEFVSLWTGDVRLASAAIDHRASAASGPDLVVDLDSDVVKRLRALTRRGSLEVRAVDDTGRPVLEFTARAGDDASGAFPPRREPDGEADGTATFADLAPGDYFVAIEAPGYAPAWKRIAVAPGTLATEVRFELIEGIARIDGRVVDPEGVPYNDADVFLYRPDGQPALPPPQLHLKSDARGEFSFRDLPAGSYVVIAEKPLEKKFAAACLEVWADEDIAPIELRFTRGHLVTIVPSWEANHGGATDPLSLSYRVLDEAGLPLLDHSRPGNAIMTGGSERELLLPAGHFTVEVRASRLDTPWVQELERPGRADFRVPGDERVVVEMPPSRR